jgi:hypothetical protein
METCTDSRVLNSNFAVENAIVVTRTVGPKWEARRSAIGFTEKVYILLADMDFVNYPSVMRFLILVIDDMTGSGTPEEMASIDIFNEKLQENGHWITAGGLAAPESATVIDNRHDAQSETGKPLFAARENFSGFWLISADDQESARRLAFEGSKACNRKVELRPLLGR